MKSFTIAALAALSAQNVAAHATFQQLWVEGVDYGSQCVRLPGSNSPVTDVSSNAVRCNAGSRPASSKCPVRAGSTVTVEMHQQNGDRSCANEGIGGAHYGPVIVYMSKVADAATADGSSGWFKIFQDGWAKNPAGRVGDDDFWGVKDLNKCCGKMNVKIPADIAPGDYLLRAEVIALHTAGGSGGAQLYMSCYQLTVSGSGSASPPTVSFPGAYRASDPGILVNIHGVMSGYTVPGPAVYAGGSTKSAGSGCSGCESTCVVGSGPTPTLTTQAPPTSAAPTSAAPPTTTSTPGSNPGGCTVSRYQQCGGNGYTGCTNCASGSTCSGVSPPYYSQCL
ncbi:carbohydrate-binding module family 1 protein [Parathielavia hyrcaniae]|uniref:lytic cellulose monooxygenase (C4-dehydrogenating) n=1 Tax=Parathielavia hyrcaniae TaxID=113614 RepID=A0AAN6SZS5_9PEZI|nr:carbohydrate-binding module family 1 protein [Parathielavia hyrcaniae]